MARLRRLKKAGWATVKVESNINTHSLHHWCREHAEMSCMITFDGRYAHVAFESMFDLMKFTAEWKTV